MNFAFSDAETATKFSFSIDTISTVLRWLCLKDPHIRLELYLKPASLVLINGQLVSFIYPKYDKLVSDNPRIRLPKLVWHVCNVCGSKFPSEPFTYANPLACLDVHHTDKVLSLSVPYFTIG